MRLPSLLTSAALILIGINGQTPASSDSQQQPVVPPVPAAAAPAPVPSPPSPWTRHGTDFSIWLDGYASGNFNNPDSGFNDLRNFDFRANTAHLSLAKISIDHAPAPFGFHADVGFGQTLTAIHVPDPGPDGLKYVEQAYISLKPKSWKGLELDFGKFVTSSGAEVIEASSNWNYSRSFLFAWAIPYYHMGFRASFPVGPHFTAGVQVVNGWNNDADNNSGKTIGLVGAYAWKRVTWTNTYYGGPEKNNTNKGIRNLFDSVVQFNQNDNTSYYWNIDWGRENNLDHGSKTWHGAAFAMRRALGKKFAIAPRIEYFNDRDGLTTGSKNNLKEVTLTGEYKVNNWLVSRLEFRNDFSDHAFFGQSGGRLSKTQPTIALGLMAYLGPKK